MNAWAVATLVAALSLAAPAAAQDPLVWVHAGTPDDPHGVGLLRGYDDVVDSAAHHGARLGAPVESREGDAAAAAGAAKIPLDPEWRPGSITLRARDLVMILPDGTFLHPDLPDLTVGMGVDSNGREDLSLADLGPARGGPRASATQADGSSSPLVEGSATPYAPTLSSPAPGGIAATAPPAGEPIPTTAAPSDGAGATVRPSAVALQPVADDGRARAAAIGAAAIGALLALWPLYHRLKGSATLQSGTRRTIYDLVCARPGAGVAEIAEKAGVSYSTATYHLDRLVGAGMLVSSSEGAKLRYYKNGGFNEHDRKLVPILENAEAMRLLDLIRATPGTYRAALADALNVTTTTVNWHLKRLMAAGLVREERLGRSAHLYAVEEKLDAAVKPLSERLQVVSA